MADRDCSHHELSLELSQIVERFAHEGPSVRRLAIENGTIRSVCEDFLLARETLARLEAAGQPAAALDDYRTLVVELAQELEREIAKALR